jgi:hypothetical protein
VDDRGFAIDRATQAWVRATGRRLSFDAVPWLSGPIGDPRLIGDNWLAGEAGRLGGAVSEGGGLLGSVMDLAGEGFDPTALAPPIRDFYERTDQWRLEVWSQWCPVAWPFGWLLSAVFSRRLEQLSLPLRPLDVAHGMDSRVLTVHDPEGHQLGAAWFRNLRATGQTVYSGFYGTVQLPKAQRPAIRVAFPLPNGNITVFLRPDNGPTGGLILPSPTARFGDIGAYLVLADRDRTHCWARRVPLAERFEVWVDRDGLARTDHALDLGQLPVIRLHYRMDRIAS